MNYKLSCYFDFWHLFYYLRSMYTANSRVEKNQGGWKAPIFIYGST